VSIVAIVLLVCAVLLVAAAEWPRLAERLGIEAREQRRRARQKQRLRVIHGEGEGRREPPIAFPPDVDADVEDFAASVQRDLDRLPVVDPDDGKRG
jgi:hypothetical protein